METEEQIKETVREKYSTIALKSKETNETKPLSRCSIKPIKIAE
jgi:hypothetical protein